MDLDDWPLVLGQTRSAAPDSGVDSLGLKQAPFPEPFSIMTPSWGPWCLNLSPSSVGFRGER